MIPSNFIPAGPLKKQRFVPYTDGSSSREIEEEIENEIPLIVQFREKLMRILELIKELEEELNQL